jgi:hypothetical protein
MKKRHVFLVALIVGVLLVPGYALAMASACCGVEPVNFNAWDEPDPACPGDEVIIGMSWDALQWYPEDEWLEYDTGYWLQVANPKGDVIVDDQVYVGSGDDNESWGAEYFLEVKMCGEYQYVAYAYTKMLGLTMYSTAVSGTITVENCCPAVVECTETVNPHGKNTPGEKRSDNAKAQAVNPDGFYELWAWGCDGNTLDVKVGCVECRDADPDFTPFVLESGTIVKFTEAPGAVPSMKKIGSDNGKAGAVVHHITLPSEPIVWARAPGGCPSWAPCFVPPPPK